MRAVLLLPALLASCRASVYPSPYPSLCDEVEACVLEVGRVCAHKHLQTTVLKFMTLEYFDCIDHTAFDAEGCFVEDDSKRDACLTVASPSEDGPQEDHALWLDFQKVEGYLECVDELAEERYQAATTGDACWTQCPPLCGDSLSFDDEERVSRVFERFFCGDGRGGAAGGLAIPWRRVAARPRPRRGYSMDTRRGPRPTFA